VNDLFFLLVLPVATGSVCYVAASLYSHIQAVRFHKVLQKSIRQAEWTRFQRNYENPGYSIQIDPTNLDTYEQALAELHERKSDLEQHVREGILEISFGNFWCALDRVDKVGSLIQTLDGKIRAYKGESCASHLSMH
jgi:hypothetical protein